MCTGVEELAMVGMAAASTATTAYSATARYKSEQDQAQNEINYQKDLKDQRSAQINENNTLAAADARTQYTALLRRSTEENFKAATEDEKATVEAGRARSQATVAAGESGAAGLSVDSLLRDFDRQEAVGKNIRSTNLNNLQAGLRTEAASVMSTTAGREQSLQPYIPRQITTAGPLGSLMEIGSSATGNWYKYYGKDALAADSALKKARAGGPGYTAPYKSGGEL